MLIKHLHNWNLSYKDARAVQTGSAGKVDLCPLPANADINIVAGLDCAFTKDKKRILAVVVVLDIDTLQVVETQHAVADVTFPYIPGLLSFREAPVCLQAIEKLESVPDVFLIDGQGIAHQRRLGLASHLGLFIDKPTIGCAKSRLIGSYKQPYLEKGSYTDLLDKDDLIGAVVRTRTNVKPLFISPGHKCSFDDVISITLRCTTRYRLPEPTRLAHQLVSKLKLSL